MRAVLLKVDERAVTLLASEDYSVKGIVLKAYGGYKVNSVWGLSRQKYMRTVTLTMYEGSKVTST